MVNSRTCFNVKTLNKLLVTPHSCVSLRKCERHIALNPNALNDIKESIRAHLNRLVTKFDAELDAVVIGFRSINVLTNLGVILHDSPHVHLDIEAEFYLFRPEKGSTLSGVVSKISRDNIGCLVHDIFNASIPLDLDEQVEGIDINGISIGEPLTFRVSMVDFSESLPYIQGKLFDFRDDSPKKSPTKKRKKSDEHEVRKKIKSEVVDYLSLEENAHDNFNTTLSSKLPTSILKRKNVCDGSSPARRISFYGDKPEISNYIAEEDNFRKKKKKKRINDNEDSVEDSSVQAKKSKKSLRTSENELDKSGDSLEHSEQINTSPTRNEKRRKKKHMEQNQQEVEMFNTEEEHVVQDLIDHHQKKKRNKGKVNDDPSEINEVSQDPEKSNALGAVKTKKKKKETLLSEEEPKVANSDEFQGKKKKQTYLNRHELSEETETYPKQGDNDLSQLSMMKKKEKKKVPLYDQNNEDADIEEQYGEEILKNNERKKKNVTSEIENKIFKSEKNNEDVAVEISNKSVLGKLERKKKKKKTSEIIEQPITALVFDHQQSADCSCESDPQKKKKSKKKKNETNQDTTTKKGKVNQDPPSANIVMEKNEHWSFGQNDGTFSMSSKIKNRVNSTIKTSTDPLKEKKNQHSSSNDSFESLSPIIKHNDLESDENLGFVTSTQKETHTNKKKVSSGVKRTNDDSFQSFSPIKNQDFDNNDSFEFITSTQIETHPNKKKVSSSIRKKESSSKSLKTKSDTTSDTDSSSSTVVSNFTPKETTVALGQKMSGWTGGVTSNSAMMKPAGSDFSSSDPDEPSAQERLQDTYKKTKEVLSPKTVVSKNVHADKSGSELDTLLIPGLEKKQLLSNAQRLSSGFAEFNDRSEDRDSTDSDLPYHMLAQKKLLSLPGRANMNENQLNKKTNMPLSGEPHRSDLQTSNPIAYEKKMKGSIETKHLSAAKKYNDGKTSNDDLGYQPLPKPLVHKTKAAARKDHKDKHVLATGLHRSDYSSSESDLPSDNHSKISVANKKKSTSDVLKQTKHSSETKKNKQDNNEKFVPMKKPLPSPLKAPGSKSSSSDSDFPSDIHNTAPSITQKTTKLMKQTERQPKSDVKNVRESSISDSDLPSDLHNKAPLKKKGTKHTKHQSKSEVKNVRKSDSDYSVEMQPSAIRKKLGKNPLTLSLKPSDSKSSSSDSDPPSKVADKLSPRKKKKSENELKQTKHVRDTRKISESETDTLIQGLLQRAKSKMLDSDGKSKPRRVKETSKGNSKSNDGATSVIPTSGTKEKKKSSSKETVNNAKSNKSGKSEIKYNVEENLEELSSLADELLKNYGKH